MGLVNWVLTSFFKSRYDNIESFIKHPVATQERLFKELIQLGSHTVWGEKFDYKSIKSIKTFQERVPVQDYDTLKPYIQRTMNGEQKVLWPSEIKWFAKSSGTTSDKSKFIPVSKEALDDCHFKAAKDLLAIYIKNKPETDYFGGKSVVLGGSTEVNRLNDDTYTGDVSAVMMKNMPWLAHLIKVPNLSIALMDNWEEKIDLMARETLKKNITNIVGVPTWTIVLIKKLFEITGKDNLLDIWPNLELYIHGGVNFTPYRANFNELIRGDQMNYMETYNASEGFFGIQYELSRRDMLLMLDYGIFYEFVPLANIHDEQPDALTLEELEVGQHYAVLITTNAGLWRYQIGDTIEVTSSDPFMIKVSGRVKHFINAFGEEVIIDNAEQALEYACKQTNALVKEYTAAPIYFSENTRAGHEWIIEFDRHPADPAEFTKLLDEGLRAVNSDYDAKRSRDVALVQLQLHVAPEHLFYEWMRKRGKLGGQHKVPRLANNRQYVDQLLLMM